VPRWFDEKVSGPRFMILGDRTPQPSECNFNILHCQSADPISPAATCAVRFSKMSREGYTHFKYFLVTSASPSVTHVQINRPNKLNAFYEPMWIEFGQIFDKLSYDSDVRAIVLSGAGEKAFSAGLDVQAAREGGTFGKKGDVARLAVAFRRHVDEFQKCIASVERCEKRMYASMTVFCSGGLTVQ
jgi:1,4-dihydroxy-2-naphthoyl-CoA synthase